MQKTKVCTRCGKEIPSTNEYFYKAIENKDGLQNICKICNKEKYAEKRKENYILHKDEKKEYQKEYYDKNKDKRIEYSNEYRKNNKDKIALKDKIYRNENKDYYKNYNREYRENNKEALLAHYKKYYAKNKDMKLSYAKHYRENKLDTCKARKYNLEYRLKNMEQLRKNRTTYARIRRAKDFKYKLNEIMSNYIYQSLHGNKNFNKWETLVGYKMYELIEHIEKQFKPGMTWKNHSMRGWHIDHKRPISSFNFTNSDDPQFKECWSLDNLQPLWAKDNLTKSNKY